MKNILIFRATQKFKPEIEALLAHRSLKSYFTDDLEHAFEIMSDQKTLAFMFDMDSAPEDAQSILNQLNRRNSPPVLVVGKRNNAGKLNKKSHNSIYAFLEKPVDEGMLSSTLFDIENDFGHTYRDLIEQQSMFGVCILQDNKFKFVNKKFVDITGYSYEDLLNNIDALDIITPLDRQYVQKHYNRLVNDESESVNITFTARKKDESELDVEVWSGKILFNGHPAVQAIVADISERRAFQLREKAYEFRMMNEQKLASIGQLATGIAHNLNTPISVILSNAELLQLKYADSPELDKIIRQADRMSQIINGLLTKSKQEQIQYPQEIDLNDLVENELEFLNSNLEFKHNVEKEYKFASNLPSIEAVYGDFSQSIMNILQNAVDAMYQREQKKLTIQTRNDDKYIYLIIKDTGCGIEEENLNRLFDPFYSTKPSPLERKGDEPTGTGLGLSTVYNLLAPYGIEIKIYSKINSGTTVTLKIPLKNSQKSTV